MYHRNCQVLVEKDCVLINCFSRFIAALRGHVQAVYQVKIGGKLVSYGGVNCVIL